MSSHQLPFYPPIDQSYGSSPPQPLLSQQSQYQKYSNNVYQHQIPINSASTNTTTTTTTYTSTPKQVNATHHYNLHHQAPSYSMVSPPTSNYTASVAQKRSLSTEDDEADSSTQPANKRLDCYNEKSLSYQQQYLNR